MEDKSSARAEERNRETKKRIKTDIDEIIVRGESGKSETTL
jgi:hypothetical protein